MQVTLYAVIRPRIVRYDLHRRRIVVRITFRVAEIFSSSQVPSRASPFGRREIRVAIVSPQRRLPLSSPHPSRSESQRTNLPVEFCPFVRSRSQLDIVFAFYYCDFSRTRSRNERTRFLRTFFSMKLTVHLMIMIASHCSRGNRLRQVATEATVHDVNIGLLLHFYLIDKSTIKILTFCLISPLRL